MSYHPISQNEPYSRKTQRQVHPVIWILRLHTFLKCLSCFHCLCISAATSDLNLYRSVDHLAMRCNVPYVLNLGRVQHLGNPTFGQYKFLASLYSLERSPTCCNRCLGSFAVFHLYTTIAQVQICFSCFQTHWLHTWHLNSALKPLKICQVQVFPKPQQDTNTEIPGILQQGSLDVHEPLHLVYLDLRWTRWQ